MSESAYYNEWEPYPAQWLRNLIKAGLIAPGDVDERSIKDIKADDLKGYAQCHFFAGIGGWSYALRLAGWEDSRPVWTGSCPCQPFSVTGKKRAQQDERHLWPVWFDLIRECQPPTIFGEQVAAAITHGWLDDAFNDLEREGYEAAAAVLPACSVGAPHKRDRLWFVGNAIGATCEWGTRNVSRKKTPSSGEREQNGNLLVRSQYAGEGHREDFVAYAGLYSDRWCDGIGQWEREPAEIVRDAGERGRQETCMPIPERLLGRVAHGIPAAAHKLRAYGNAIVPQVAQAFIEAFMECRP